MSQHNEVYRARYMTPDNIEFLDLLSAEMKQYIAEAECEQGYLYWGIGRGIGEIAICAGHDSQNGTKFYGLAKNEINEDSLDSVLHTQIHPVIGGWSPIVRLESVPEGMDRHQTMEWLLGKHIEVVELRLDWLACMPAHLRGTASYEPVVSENEALLASLVQEQRAGFKYAPETNSGDTLSQSEAA
jgi:hypothetical protein